MATLLPAVRANIEWLDTTGSVTYSGCHRHSSEEVTAVNAAVTSLCATLSTVSDAVIAGYTATWSMWISDTWPIGGVTHNHGITLIFGTSIADEYVMVDIVGVPTSYIVDGMIDITNADIAAIGENIISSGYCNPFGTLATELLAAVPTLTP
jgi:hypothetical protein